MKSTAIVLITGLVAFVAGGAAIALAALGAASALVSQGGMSFGGALDPVTGTIALGLGGAALARKWRKPKED